jgi:hypothetical protein
MISGYSGFHLGLIRYPPVVPRVAARSRGWADYVGRPCGAPLILPAEDVPDQVWRCVARCRQGRGKVAGKFRIARDLLADAGVKKAGYHGRSNQCESHVEEGGCGVGLKHRGDMVQ